MNNDLYNRKDPVHRVLDACLCVVIAAGVGYWLYAFNQVLGG